MLRSTAYTTLLRDGRYGLARRLAMAEAASRESARDALIEAGRALARRDRDGWRAACLLAAAHYRAAGDASMATHWTRRASLSRAV